jgi:hypothetical protein
MERAFCTHPCLPGEISEARTISTSLRDRGGVRPAGRGGAKPRGDNRWLSIWLHIEAVGHRIRDAAISSGEQAAHSWRGLRSYRCAAACRGAMLRRLAETMPIVRGCPGGGRSPSGGQCRRACMSSRSTCPGGGFERFKARDFIEVYEIAVNFVAVPEPILGGACSAARQGSILSQGTNAPPSVSKRSLDDAGRIRGGMPRYRCVDPGAILGGQLYCG